MICPRCGAEYRPGYTYCADCGVKLTPASADAQTAACLREAEARAPRRSESAPSARASYADYAGDEPHPHLWEWRQSFVGSAFAGQSRFLTALLWAGVIFGVFGLWAAHAAGGGAVATFLISAVLCAVGLIVRASNARDLSRTTPEELSRVWYRVSAASVAMRWRWCGGVAMRVRVLRSEQRSASSPHETGSDQALIYEGSGDHVLDDGVEARTTYHYTMWVTTDEGAWTDPVRLLLTPMEATELKHIESTYEQHTAGIRGREPRGAPA